MTDEHELDPELDAQVRALLADLGSTPTEAIPDDVAARLDATLAGLVEERAAGSEPSTVVPLRRRWAPRVAAAAAAVIVVGIGGVTVANLGGVDGLTSSTDADSKAADDGGGTAAGQAESAPESVSPSAPAGDTDSQADKALAVPAVRSDTFEADATRILGGDAATGDSELSKDPLAAAGQETARNQLRVAGCQGPRVPAVAAITPVQYDGTLAVLVIYPARAGQQLVEAWDCAGDQRLDSARVPTANTGLASPSPSP